ncbi:metallophosphoesterase family protein [Comamonas thiooxydans]|uniref:metallophosphoesterase family protein n=1 Tax=Comamonas thiooxydans TaxID=363952 RepID=UPI0009B83149|nr:metallophosphoesterase [Comamonas thiooxydans]
MSKGFNWLHISDLHAGQSTQDWLWPTLQSQFFSDIKRLINQVGTIDLVIFSGDLTQSGSEDDFSELHKILIKIWAELKSLGSTPELFMVPGNHDLVRPKAGNINALALKSWWTDGETKKTFWDSEDTTLRTAVNSFFSNYKSFLDKLTAENFPLVKTVPGILTGDSSGIIKKGEQRIGIIGLNSSYLHFSDTEKDPNLDIHVQQLMSVTKNNPDDWVKSNTINLLVTHHPVDWFHQSAREHFHSEINPPGRFTAHLYGHMHKQDILSLAIGGGTIKRSFQAASLFGLRKISHLNIDRSHGYSLNNLTINDGKGTIKIWPRTTQIVGSGSRKFVPDVTMDLDEDNSFSLVCENNGEFKPAIEAETSPQSSFKDAAEDAANQPDISLSPLLSRLRPAPIHSSIRIVEQRIFRQALSSKGIAWLICDWNYGGDEFLWSVFNEPQRNFPLVFRFNLNRYLDRDSFFSEFKAQAGCSFQEFSKSVVAHERVILILDEVPVQKTHPNLQDVEIDIEELVEAFHDYCPNSNTIIISQLNPKNTKFPVVALHPLEEADVRTYIAQTEEIAAQYSDASSINDIYRITEGIPLEIDNLVKQLQYASLTEILEEKSSIESKFDSKDNSKSSLFSAITKLRESTEPSEKRAFNLLRALSIFPDGETVSRIKHFDNNNPFHITHTEILDNYGFIEIQHISPTMQVNDQKKTTPKIRAKKFVRDLILSELETDQLIELNKKAAAIYFGSDCFIGTPKNIKTTDIVQILGSSGLENPHGIVTTLLKNVLDSYDKYRYDQIIRLARIFSVDLENEDSYRRSVSFCQDILRILPNESIYQTDINWFKFKLGSSLRMIGSRDASTTIFSELDLSQVDKTTKRRILINWALAEEKKNPAKAIELARDVMSLGEKTLQALEAEFIILKNSPNDKDNIEKLRTLETRAIKKKQNSLLNNIGLHLDLITPASTSERCNSLMVIGNRALKNNDRYTFSRAYVRLGRITRGSVQEIDYELSNQIIAYQYLYEERIEPLFSDSHENLWNQFISRGEFNNLLRLFRHSSYIWRLSGDETKEIPYIKQLGLEMPHLLNRSDEGQSIEANYFAVRAEKMQPFLGKS